MPRIPYSLAAAIAAVMMLLMLAGCPPGPGAGPTPDVGPPTPRPQPSGEAIKLGAIMPNTGSFATFGQSSTKAMRLAVEEINSAGGVLGRRLELIVEDTQCRPEEAANAAQKLVHQDRVLCVIGEVASSNTLAAAPISQDARTPQVTPASTNPAVTEVGDHIFRVCFTDDFQGLVMARFAREELDARTAVIFSDVSSDYSRGLAEVFRETFTGAGGEVLAQESFTQGDRDFRAQLTKLRGLNPDVIYIPAYYSEVALILSQARQLGITAVGIGADGWDSPKLVEIAADAAEGGFFSNHYSKDDPRPTVQDFVAAFEARYNEIPDALAALAYDAIRIVTQAIERAGVAERAALRDALARTRDFDGVTGTITFDENRNARKSATVLTIKDGRQEFVKTMTPG